MLTIAALGLVNKKDFGTSEFGSCESYIYTYQILFNFLTEINLKVLRNFPQSEFLASMRILMCFFDFKKHSRQGFLSNRLVPTNQVASQQHVLSIFGTLLSL